MLKNNEDRISRFNERKRNVNRELKRELNNEELPKYLKSYENCEAITKQSKKECKRETRLKAIDALYITLAFAGMVCLCIPAAQVFAPFFIIPAAAYFTSKYSVQIVSAVKSIHSFFSKKENHKSTKEQSGLNSRIKSSLQKKT